MVKFDNQRNIALESSVSMFRKNESFPARSGLVLGVLIVLGLGGSAGADLSEPVVSQKNRRFDPTTVDLVKGGALIIENDDGDLVHHAYVDSDGFSFDSGDQQPGSRTRVVFSVPGDFKVLCGIHPKMKLAVHVR